MENNYSFFDGLLEQVELEHSLFESTLRSKFRSIKVLKEDGDVNTQAAPDENPAPEQANQDTDDGTKTKFIDKVKEIATKFIEWLKKVFTTIAEKIKNVIFKDSTIIKKYREILTTKDNALDGFPGIDNFSAANLNYELPIIDAESLINSYLLGINTEEPDGFKEDADDLKEKCEGAFEKEDKWYGYNKADWNKAFDKFTDEKMQSGALKIAKAIAAKEGSFKNKLNNFSYKLGQKIGGAIVGKEARESDKFKEAMKNANETFNYIQPIMKTFITTYIGYFKALRRACIVCGTYALKNIKGEAGENATPEQQAATESLVWLVDVQNSQYLDEAFSFI